MIDPADPDYINTPVAPQRPTYAYRPADTSAAPCVSIVTPFYNTGPVFHQTARCIFQQSLQQWEWIIVNDGSTDAEALAVLQEYRERDPRIRVLDHAYNRGLSAARNTGFQAARALYVVQLDSDDLLEATAAEKWLWFLESYPEYGFVKGYTVGFEARTYLWQKGFHSGKAFLEENIVAATSMIRTAVHDAAGGYDETFRGGLEDWDFWLRCASHGQWGERCRTISTGIGGGRHTKTAGQIGTSPKPYKPNCSNAIPSCGQANFPTSSSAGMPPMIRFLKIRAGKMRLAKTNLARICAGHPS